MFCAFLLEELRWTSAGTSNPTRLFTVLVHQAIGRQRLEIQSVTREASHCRKNAIDLCRSTRLVDQFGLHRCRSGTRRGPT